MATEGHDMKKLTTALVSLVLIMALASPAAAHVQVVDPPGKDDAKVGWVGGPALPGHGQGLIPGGPTGEVLLTPAHAGGLIQACEAIRSQGQAAVDIWGPPGPGGCAHGTF
jgi:hypothetical protein